MMGEGTAWPAPLKMVGQQELRNQSFPLKDPEFLQRLDRSDQCLRCPGEAHFVREGTGPLGHEIVTTQRDRGLQLFCRSPQTCLGEPCALEAELVEG